MKTVLPFLLALSVSAAAQTTIHVPGDQPTIQAAIQVAVDGDTVLVAPGTYVEQLDLLGRAITVRSEAGAGTTTIDSQGLNQWPDWPYHPVVRMMNGEGAATVIEGFTITGANDPLSNGGAAGINCMGLSPTIRKCRLVDNVGGPGLWGGGTIEDCVITGNENRPYRDGGGVSGTSSDGLTIRRCTISDNTSGGFGGGIMMWLPGVVEDCLIQRNVAGNGFDGYSGGGVWGPAMLEGCVITDNVAHYWLSGGPPDEIGSGVDRAIWIDRCTIAFNRIGNSDGNPANAGGGIKDVPWITNSIIWGNEDREFSAYTSPLVTYSTVKGHYWGTGNQGADPLFRNPGVGDYFLQYGSPAIDAGDPGATLDPDGTVADMGGLYFPQFPASAVVRNGTGVNPLCYASLVDPVIGTTWTATVDANAHGFSGALTLVAFYTQPSAPLALSFGELLVDPTSGLVWLATAVPAGGTATFAETLPDDYALGGLTVYGQAVVAGGGLGLCNALDVTLGL